MQAPIPQPLYEKILDVMPILCVDFVLYDKGKVLLTRRTDEPAKDQWWVQGGRVFKHETLDEAVQRLSKREVGLEVEVIKQLGVYEYQFDKANFGITSGTHTVAVTYLVKPREENFQVSLDTTHSSYRWVDQIEKDLDPYVKRVLRDANVF